MNGGRGEGPAQCKSCKRFGHRRPIKVGKLKSVLTPRQSGCMRGMRSADERIDAPPAPPLSDAAQTDENQAKHAGPDNNPEQICGRRRGCCTLLHTVFSTRGASRKGGCNACRIKGVGFVCGCASQGMPGEPVMADGCAGGRVDRPTTTNSSTRRADNISIYCEGEGAWRGGGANNARKSDAHACSALPQLE